MSFWDDFSKAVSDKFTSTINSLETSIETLIVGDPEKEKTQEPSDWIDHEYWKNAKDQTLFTVTLGYNLMTQNSDTMPWWNLVGDHIVLGALPFREDVPKIAALGVGGVLTLNMPFELEPNKWGVPATPEDWVQSDIINKRVQTPDFHAPTIPELEECVLFMETIIASNKKVYVHCKAGRGRSVVATVCYLIKNHHFTGEEATQYVKKRRPQINMGVHQNKSCRDFEEAHGMPLDKRRFLLIQRGLQSPESVFSTLPESIINQIISTIITLVRDPPVTNYIDFTVVGNFFSSTAAQLSTAVENLQVEFSKISEPESNELVDDLADEIDLEPTPPQEPQRMD